MSAEPTKVDNQPAGEAATAAAPVEATTQPAETKAADSNPPAAVSAAAEAPAEAKPATETAAPAAAAAAEQTAAKEEPKEEAKTESKDEKPKEEAPKEEAPKETPLTKLANRLDEIKKAADHDEVWGVTLSNLDHAPTAVVLQKFLRANDQDVTLAEKQLTSTLEWRKKTNPTALLDEKVYDRSKFGDLGYVTEHKDDKGKEVVITWNVYGAVKDNKATFGNIKEFLDWRVALMEFGTRKLNINEAKAPIPEGEEDPYRMVQVHDYFSVSFLRMDPHIKAASKETIQTLSMAYPELLAHKYFVNVPTIMGWVFSAMKLFLSPATLRKFHPLSSGTTLATNEMPAFASSLPKEYGGSGPSVKEGLTVKLTDAPAPAEDDKKDNAAKAAESEPKKDDAPKEAPKEEAKPEETKDAKPEESKAEEGKETKTEEAKPEESKAAEAPAKDEPAVESKVAETKA